MKARFLIAERRKCMQRFYFQYQTEAMPKGISVEQFCLKNKVPYNIFSKWYRDTRKKIVEVQVDGKPIQSEQQPSKSPEDEKYQKENSSVRILVEIRMGGLLGNISVSFLLKYLTVAEILLACDPINFRANECRVKLA